MEGKQGDRWLERMAISFKASASHDTSSWPSWRYLVAHEISDLSVTCGARWKHNSLCCRLYEFVLNACCGPRPSIVEGKLKGRP